MTTAESVANMTLTEAQELRDRLDATPAKELPGADQIGAWPAMRAYTMFRTLLTTRINQG